MDYAIIGGTGVYIPGLLENEAEKTISTPYGDAHCLIGHRKGRKIVFLPRHSKDHKIPPHKINYVANMWALKYLGVKYIIGTNAVGSANPHLRPGDFVLIDQFLDFTKTRCHTFFDGENTPVVHVDVTNPYCPTLRQMLMDTAGRLGLEIHKTGCYACFEGPRYETAAEIKMVHALGGDLVGMTNVPEVTLAREAGICYAAVCVVTNMGAGMIKETLSHSQVEALMKNNIEQIREWILQTVDLAVAKPCTMCPPGIQPLPGM